MKSTWIKRVGLFVLIKGIKLLLLNLAFTYFFTSCSKCCDCDGPTQSEARSDPKVVDYYIERLKASK